MKPTSSMACVLGDMDLVRPLGLAGVLCAVAVQPGAGPRYSRFTKAAIDWSNPWDQPDALIESLISFAKTQPAKPVLFYESDGELLLISRNRQRLAEFFNFVIADETLVEDLVDKERFQELAELMSLPVPPAVRIHPNEEFKDLNLRFPIIVKPLTRRPDQWRSVTDSGKAFRVESIEELQKAWPQLASSGVELLAQELIAGPESQVESYHVYIDANGEVAGEFTGRKIRTYPLEYGDSTALETTDAADVRSLGRDIARRIGLRGVAKFDFKRSADGTLFLLEINPRFNLWHHLGALAGVNLPALVYADMTERPRPPHTVAVPGILWSRVWQDAQSAMAAKLSPLPWLAWTIRCEAKRMLSWDDPMPFVRAAAWKAAAAARVRFGKSFSNGHSKAFKTIHEITRSFV